ncbi:lysozyme-like domain-containing protein, partial [Ilyonectria destructans]
LQLVKSFEGWRPDFYCDLTGRPPSSPRYCGPGEGTLTIGWGHACQPASACNSIDPPLSTAEGESLLRTDVQTRVSCVTSAVTVDLTQNQLDALVSFTYNEGCGAFRSVAAKLNADDFQGATDKMKEYNRAGGAVSPVVVRRRAIEVNMFNS